jgi:hypothetical protein
MIIYTPLFCDNMAGSMLRERCQHWKKCCESVANTKKHVARGLPIIVATQMDVFKTWVYHSKFIVVYFFNIRR